MSKFFELHLSDDYLNKVINESAEQGCEYKLAKASSDDGGKYYCIKTYYLGLGNEKIGEYHEELDTVEMCKLFTEALQNQGIEFRICDLYISAHPKHLKFTSNQPIKFTEEALAKFAKTNNEPEKQDNTVAAKFSQMREAAKDPGIKI
ncbi:MAG: hypothetical protein LBM38_04300 [Clostridiales bacterium]|jgi:hypothetical protein|nr:hypothetical protein [Clostridiales bacterium]